MGVGVGVGVGVRVTLGVGELIVMLWGGFGERFVKSSMTESRSSEAADNW